MASAQHFVDTTRAALAPMGNGQAYQNYPDANLTSWRTAYYGSRYCRPRVASSTSATPMACCAFPQAIGS